MTMSLLLFAKKRRKSLKRFTRIHNTHRIVRRIDYDCFRTISDSSL